MPTGTRSNIKMKSVTKPMMATASVLIERSLHGLDLISAAHQLGLENQTVGANGDEQNGGDVARPSEREKRPGRQPQIKGQDIVMVGADDFVEQGRGLHAHHEKQDKGRKDIDESLPSGRYVRPDKVDGDVGAPIGGRG